MLAMMPGQGAGIACTGSPGGVPGPFPAWCASWRPGRARWRRAGGPVRTQRVAEFGCAQVKVKTTVRITGGVLATPLGEPSARGPAEGHVKNLRG